ncbi:MAG: inositol-phosphate phosphatase [Chloroflexi bacterium]|nr:inositol-phosphate phosphatase [Chloroflexota bacterium]
MSERRAADLAFAIALAERAGRLLASRYERVESIELKGAKDVVTEVDHASEALVLRAIRRRFPADGFLGEEGGARPVEPGPGQSGGPGRSANAAARSHPASDARPALAGGRVWVVDPLDGTVNFANGLPFFCFSLALVEDGRPVVGVIRDPLRRETFAASDDGPALLGGRPVRVSRKTRLVDLVVALSVAGRGAEARARSVRRVVRITRSMGSAALSCAYVANGRFDAFGQSAGLSSWDIAAAGLIAERAGATVTAIDGGPWFRLDAPTGALGLMAAPPAHHARLLELVREP